MIRKHKNIVRFLIYTFTFLLGTTSGYAATYYVATSGSDSNPGTLQQPFRTIVKGVSILKPGDTTYVRAGTYNEAINTRFVVFPSGTSWTNAVTLAAYPGEQVTLVGFINLAGMQHSYIIVSGLIIDANNSVEGFTINQGSHHIRLQNSEIKNTWSNGVGIWWGNNNGLSSDYNEILNCRIHHIGSAGNAAKGWPDQPFGYGLAHGIYVTTSNNIIRGNTFYDIGEYSIHQWTSAPYFANNNIFDGNIITRSGHNTTRYGGVCCGGITASGGNGTIIRNNIVYGNEVDGIDLMTTCINCKVYNNTTYNNPGWNIYTPDTSGTGIEVRNNIAYPKGIHLGTGTISSNNLLSNPNFVNAAGNDFRLLSSSPAVDAGMTLSSVTVDFARSIRPQGAAYDIGAYEFGGGTGSAPAAPRNLSVR
jgi:parallel beta-helix repeat protein